MEAGTFSYSLPLFLPPPSLPPPLFLLIRSINVSNLKFIRNMLLFITHKGSISPSPWLNWKCHGPVSAASSDGAAVFRWQCWHCLPSCSVRTRRLHRWCGKDVVHSLCHDFHSLLISFPSFPPDPDRTLSTLFLLHVNTLSLFPGNPHHIPSHSFLSKWWPNYLFKGLLSPYKLCREKMAINSFIEKIAYSFCFMTRKKKKKSRQFTCEALGWCLVI